VQRWLTPVVAALSTAIFVVVRNTLDLEESRFVLALLACSALALALTVALGVFFRSSTRSSVVVLGVVSFILVPLLYVAYLVLFVVTVCIIGGETCYS